MYIIKSEKKNISAISGTNNSVEFHNKLFDTDDCVITWQDDPTPEDIESARLQREQDLISFREGQEKEDLIQAKLREMAEAELVTEGKLNIAGKVVLQPIEGKI